MSIEGPAGGLMYLFVARGNMIQLKHRIINLLLTMLIVSFVMGLLIFGRDSHNAADEEGGPGGRSGQSAENVPVSALFPERRRASVP